MRGHQCRFYTCLLMTESQTRNQNQLQYTHWRPIRPQLFSAFVYLVTIEPPSQNCEIRLTSDRESGARSGRTPITFLLSVSILAQLSLCSCKAHVASLLPPPLSSSSHASGRTEEKRDLEALRTDGRTDGSTKEVRGRSKRASERRRN